MSFRDYFVEHFGKFTIVLGSFGSQKRNTNNQTKPNQMANSICDDPVESSLFKTICEGGNVQYSMNHGFLIG